MRILIVEDDPLLADGLTRSLRQGDYAVDCVGDGLKADHALAAQGYDLLILDLGIPGVDGFEVLRRLRRRGSKTPVLWPSEYKSGDIIYPYADARKK